MGKTLLVIGWDAATKSHLDSFELPFHGGLDYQGILQPESYWQNREVDSGSAWTTITTGLSMWDHGIATLSGMIESPRRLRIYSKIDGLIPRNLADTPARIWGRKLALGDQPTNDDIPFKRVWHYIPDSLAAFVPLTYPPKPTAGITISGFPSPEVAVEPKEFEKEIQKRYDGEPERKFTDSGDVREGYIDDLFECHKQRVETILYLAEKEDFSLIFPVFTILDRLLHVVEEDDDRIKDAYKLVDESTQKLVNDIDPDDVLILSDHGMKYEPRWKWQHIHDEKSGIWAASDSFDLETHLDVTPTIISYFGQEMPTDKSYEQPTSSSNTEEMEEQLRDLGYL